MGNLNIISREVDAGSALQERADKALGAAGRVEGLVSRLLAFSRRQRVAPETIDLNALIAEMSDLLGSSLGSDVTLRTALDAGIAPVLVDPGQLENALMNLAINARDAMEGNGEIVIETRGAADDDFVEVCVSDSGSGIPRELIGQVFEPFFTTKPVGKGSGLGLSMVYGFAQQSGGTVEIDSRPGDGTRVTMRLPRAEYVIAEEIPAAPGEGEDPIDACILVVDDDTDLLEITADQLRRRGYAVVTATDGAAALDMLRGIPEIDLLYTDLAMPGGIGGLELAQKAGALRPDLPVLFTSGAPWATAGQLTNLLRKPVHEDVLAAAVRLRLETYNRPTSVSKM